MSRRRVMKRKPCFLLPCGASLSFAEDVMLIGPIARSFEGTFFGKEVGGRRLTLELLRRFF
jgi:hypothetical protein